MGKQCKVLMNFGLSFQRGRGSRGLGNVDEPFEISCKMYLKRVTEIALFQLQIRRAWES